MSQHRDRQGVIAHYRETTGITEIDMKEVAKFAVSKLGWKLPEPVSPLDRLAHDFSRSAAEEYRTDKVTGEPYRVNLAVTIRDKDGKQRTLWGDNDTSPLPFVKKSFFQRREQTVGDIWQLTLDNEHRHRMHPNEEQIVLPLDYTLDIELRRNAPPGQSAA